MVALPVGLGLMALMCVPLPMDAMDALMPAILVIATAVQFWAGSAASRMSSAATRNACCLRIARNACCSSASASVRGMSIRLASWTPRSSTP